MGAFIDLSGKRFGRLTAMQRDNSKGGDVIYWLCICDCGNITSVPGRNLRDGITKSCGCFKAETSAAHFLSKDTLRKNNLRLYSIYKSMRHRCYDKKNNNYQNYGGRGIQICDQWLGEDGFLNFVNWAKSSGYCNDLTIDRISVDGNYSPENCRWITHKENQNNRRNNRYLTCGGETKTLSQWADYCGITPTELKRRLDYLGLPIKSAMSYKGLPKTEYKGRLLSIRAIAQKNNMDYKYLLHEVLVNGKNADDVVSG